jgi:hypothetical protein
LTTSSNGKDDKVKPLLPPSLREARRNVPYRDPDTEETAPTLLSLLQTTWDDQGRVNWEGAGLSLRLRAGVCFVTITCPTAQTQTTFEIVSLASLLQEVEERLSSGRLVWEDTYGKLKKNRQALADAQKPK